MSDVDFYIYAYDTGYPEQPVRCKVLEKLNVGEREAWVLGVDPPHVTPGGVFPYIAVISRYQGQSLNDLLTHVVEDTVGLFVYDVKRHDPKEGYVFDDRRVDDWAYATRSLEYAEETVRLNTKSHD